MSGELLITLFMILGAIGLPGEDANRFMHTDMCVERLERHMIDPTKYDTLENAVDFAEHCIRNYGKQDDIRALIDRIAETENANIEQGE